MGPNTHTEGDTTPFNYQLTIQNTGPNPVTIQTINDVPCGDLATRPGSTCGTLIGQTIQPGGSLTCTFSAPFAGPGQQTDTVTVTGVDNFGQPVQDSDDAVVFVTPVPPQINVDKTANPTQIGEKTPAQSPSPSWSASPAPTRSW